MKFPIIRLWPFFIIVILYLCSVIVDTMDVDASQYAYLSKEMLQSGSYLKVYEHGVSYLDKPPLLFWITAQSMRFFGINNLGFKLPSIIMAIWAIYATYRFAKLMYRESTARFAALILACSQAMFLMTNDIRTDTLLMSWVITAIWFWKEWDVQQKNIWLWAAFAAMAMGMMTKGPIALIAPVVTMGMDWLLKKKWDRIINPRHIVGLLIMALLLLPMSYGLYQQFDLHPEQVVNGKTNVSGLRFFYWTQSFGRITGENVWDNNAPFSFLFENMLWAFLPWTLLFIVAWLFHFVVFMKSFVSRNNLREWHSFLGFSLVYIMLAMSNYQLPHYLFVVYPLAAVMSAAQVEHWQQQGNLKWINSFGHIQFVIGLLLFVAGFAIVYVVFPEYKVVGSIYLIAVIITFVWLLARRAGTYKMVVGSAFAAIAINVWLTFFFYKPLLEYQSSSTIARKSNAHLKATDTLAAFMDKPFHAAYFYAAASVKRIYSAEEAQDYKWLMIDKEKHNELSQAGMSLLIVERSPYFKVSELKPAFLDYKKRHTALDTVYLVERVE